MKKGIKLILLSLLTCALSSIFVACEDETASSGQIVDFTVESEVSVEIGSYYAVPAVETTYTTGEACSVNVSVKNNGQEVVVLGGLFAVESFDDYIISYIAGTGDDVLVKTTTVKVVDTQKPIIKVGELPDFEYVNSIINLSDVVIEDNSKQLKSRTFQVTYNNEEIPITDNSFTLTNTGRYTLKVSAEDMKGNQADTFEKTITSILPMEYGYIIDFEKDGASKFNTQSGTDAKISLSTEQTYREDSYRALKYEATTDKTWEAIYMPNFRNAMPDLDKFGLVSVMIYNAGENAHEFRAEDDNSQKIKLQPKQWTKYVFNPLLGNDSDTQLHFGLWNWKAGDVQSDENLVLYFDDFRYEFDADLTVDSGTAIDVAERLQLESKGFIYKDVSVTGPNGFTANSLTFTPTGIGEYVISFSLAKADTSNYGVFRVVVQTTDKILYDFEEDVNVGASFGSNQLTEANYGYSTEIKSSGNRSLKITTSSTWFQITFWNIDTTGYSKFVLSVYVEGTGNGWITTDAGAYSNQQTGEWLTFEVDVSGITDNPKLTVNFDNVTAVYLDDVILTK